MSCSILRNMIRTLLWNLQNRLYQGKTSRDEVVPGTDVCQRHSHSACQRCSWTSGGDKAFGTTALLALTSEWKCTTRTSALDSVNSWISVVCMNEHHFLIIARKSVFSCKHCSFWWKKKYYLCSYKVCIPLVKLHFSQWLVLSRLDLWSRS